MTYAKNTKQVPPCHIGPFDDTMPSGRRVARSQLYWLRKYRTLPDNVVQRQIDVFSTIIEINDTVQVP